MITPPWLLAKPARASTHVSRHFGCFRSLLGRLWSAGSLGGCLKSSQSVSQVGGGEPVNPRMKATGFGACRICSKKSRAIDGGGMAWLLLLRGVLILTDSTERRGFGLT